MTTGSEVAAPIRTVRPGRDLAIDIVILLVLVLGLSLVIPLIFVIIAAFQQGLTSDSLQQLQAEDILRLLGVGGVMTLLVIQNLLFILIPWARVVWLRRESPAELGFTTERMPLQIAVGFGLGVAVLFGNAMIGLAFNSAGITQNQSAQYPLFAGDYLGQLAFFIGAAIVVPIGEEILFRGYLFKTLWRIWNEKQWGRVAAYGLSAFIFAIAHSLAATEGVIALLVPAFVMGLLLAWGAQKTGGLLAPIMAHMMNNGIALLGLLVCVNNPAFCTVP
jgi:membrane protease YdiL (CAAX protease family)